MKKILALAVCLALTLAAAPPAQAIIEFIILDELLNPKPDPTPTPPPAPEPAPNSFDSMPLNPGFHNVTSFLRPSRRTISPRHSLSRSIPTCPPKAPQGANPAPSLPLTSLPRKPPQPARNTPAKGGQQRAWATLLRPVLRGLRPKLTDSWYMFTLDLRQGVTSYPLVAGNSIAGSVNIVVQEAR